MHKNIRFLIPVLMSSWLTVPLSTQAGPAAPQATRQVEELIIVGTRRAARSAGDSPVPVDVISGERAVSGAAGDPRCSLRPYCRGR